MASIELGAGGHGEFEAVTGAKTLDLGDSGAIQNVTATCTVTLPATVVGTTYHIRVGAEGKTVTISPNASDKIAGGGFSPVDDKDIVFTNQPAGSYVTLVADGVNGYMIAKQLGTLTYQG